MSLSLNWSQAQKLLLDDIHAILNLLQHKRLQIKELLYILNAVLLAKLRYYTNVVPLNREDIAELDERIRGIFKRTAGLAKSFPSIFLYLPKSSPCLMQKLPDHGVDILRSIH